MALEIAKFLRAINPNIGVVVNSDGSYRIGIEDINSDEIRAALEAILESEHYTTPNHTAPDIGITSTTALAANANRLYALLINDSNETIYLKLGATAVVNEGIRLNANDGNYEMSKKLGNLYTGVINAICATGNKKLLVLEGV